MKSRIRKVEEPYEVLKTKSQIKVDAVLDEEAWKMALDFLSYRRTFRAEQPPPFYLVQYELLIATEEGRKYF